MYKGYCLKRNDIAISDRKQCFYYLIVILVSFVLIMSFKSHEVKFVSLSVCQLLGEGGEGVAKKWPKTLFKTVSFVVRQQVKLTV